MKKVNKLGLFFSIGLGVFSGTFLTVAMSPVQSVKAVMSTNSNTPRKDFVDISSNNGKLSVADFLKMKSAGVTGVGCKSVRSIKLSQSTCVITDSKCKSCRIKGLSVPLELDDID